MASLFHAGKESKNTKNNISSLKKQDEVVRDPADIEKEILDYFGALFNGYHDVNLHNRGVSFVPDNSHLDEMLHDLVSMGRCWRPLRTNSSLSSRSS